MFEHHVQSPYISSFHYIDQRTLLTRLRYLPNAYFQPEFIDEAQKQRQRRPSHRTLNEGPFRPSGSTYPAWVCQNDSLSAQPMDGRLRALGAVAAHTFMGSRARTRLSQHLWVRYAKPLH